MKLRRLNGLVALILVHGLAAYGSAQTLSPYQASQRPLGLSLIGSTSQASSSGGSGGGGWGGWWFGQQWQQQQTVKGNVYTGGTDSLSSTYMSTYQSSFLNVVHTSLPEGVAFNGINNQLDPTRLFFASDYTPRVYFLSEGACYLNALGVTVATVTAPTSNPPSGANFSVGSSYTVFPLGQSIISSVTCGTKPTQQSASYPLLPGDFVQLGTVSAGQQLAFFLMSNMNSSGTPQNVFYNGASNNPDGFQHMIAFFPDTTSQYLIIGFEDELASPGSSCDKDCNDLVFVVDVGPGNAAALRSPTLPE